MTVKLIAVDMDGTFLNDEKTYNEARFSKLFRQIEENGIKFVVASGNQYFQLRSFFPTNYKRITFVAENGANILLGDEHFYNALMSEETVQKTLTLLDELKPENLIICGKNSAYISSEVSDELYDAANFYYRKLKRINDLRQIADEGDEIFKFALSFKAEDVQEILTSLSKGLKGELVPVSSGHGDIDLIIPEVHKFKGLQRLGELWGITPDEMATFGDSGNDFEMIANTKYSFAMTNGQPKVKEVANEVIGSNNKESVLEKIEQILHHQNLQKVSV
ncbi:MAG: Cof-type HAD-IIB family hydrolase [Streptococcaceae bacterium]|nr:Cof-type HAD-IIB family hydrolase [Streptococcaceae bacterium]